MNRKLFIWGGLAALLFVAFQAIPTYQKAAKDYGDVEAKAVKLQEMRETAKAKQEAR